MNTCHNSDERGQVMILTALLMSVFVLVAAFAVDGGYGLFQSRQAQNAADFGAMAASKLTPCNSGVTTATASQVQQTVQNIVNDNESGATVTWTAKYLDGNGNAISGAIFSNTASYAPPATACGVSVNVSGTWNTSLAKLAGINTAATTEGAGALGGGSLGANLAIASLMPYARHTIYAGATGAFVVNGSMFDNSVAQCNDRYDSCENYPQCLSGTPTSNIVCYGDSADVFEQSTESISGTLYSVAPVAVDPCFYPSPASGNDPVMSSTLYSSYYNTYGCNQSFSSATNPISYGGLQGNVTAIGDPLASLPDPSGNGGTATECPGQSTVQTHATNAIASGSLNPGVYTNTVVVTGSVTLNPCISGGATTAPGLYVFQKGIEFCPTSGKTITGNDVMIFNEAAISSTYSDASANSKDYCAPASGANGTVPVGIDLGGTGGSITLSGPDSGVYKGIVLYQSRSTNLNIGLDDGWLYKCAGSGCSNPSYIADDATVNVTGVVYDNSFTNEPSNEVFSQIGQTFGGPYGALCAGTTSASDGGPTPCAGVPSGVNITDSAGSIQITGAVVVGAFGTQGGTSSKPLTLTITFQSSDISLAAGNLRLIF